MSGISDVGGHNPVFQTTLLPLLAGDVVQLQVCLENRNFEHWFNPFYLKIIFQYPLWGKLEQCC